MHDFLLLFHINDVGTYMIYQTLALPVTLSELTLKL